MASSPPRITAQTLRVLAALLSRPQEDIYGLEVVRSANLASGTVYPVLARLERAGWLTSEWEGVDPAVVGRPRRRVYRLTASGAAEARVVLAEYQRVLLPFQAPAAGEAATA